MPVDPVIARTREYALAQPWERRPRLHTLESALNNAYHRLRRAGATPDELRKATLEMEEIREMINQSEVNAQWASPEDTERIWQVTNQRIVDRYGDYSDKLHTCMPPRTPIQAGRVEHVFRATGGRPFTHAMPELGRTRRGRPGVSG